MPAREVITDEQRDEFERLFQLEKGRTEEQERRYLEPRRLLVEAVHTVSKKPTC